MSELSKAGWNDSGATEARNLLRVSGEIDLREPYTDLQLPDGKIVRLPTHLFLPSMVAEAPMETGLYEAQAEDGAELRIPVIEEELTVSKRTVATGKVLLHKTVQEFDQVVEETLAQRTYEVERVAVNRVVAAVPEIGKEGATTIYPVVEERLVLAKELVLVEEIRVTERDTERMDRQVVRLKREQVDVERRVLREGVAVLQD